MKIKSLLLFSVFLSFTLLASAKEDIKVILDGQKGTFSIVDTRDNTTVIENAGIAFVTAPYVELYQLGRDDIETDVPVRKVSSASASCSVSGNRTLVCRKDGIGELRVDFIDDNDGHFLKMAFSFKNLSSAPLRLRRVEVLDGNYFPGLDKKGLKTLGGTSSRGKTEVISDLEMEKVENNSLSYIAEPSGKDRSLVMGGLTYKDFRKFVNLEKERISLYAEDPVGKRVDPDTEYRSDDISIWIFRKTIRLKLLKNMPESARKCGIYI